MTNRDLARRFADVHPHFLYDAVILEGVVAGGRVHGRVFFDTKGRYLDDTIVSTSTILEAFAGGRVIRTRNSQYLVQMQPETEQARREASLEPPAAWAAEVAQSIDAMVEQFNAGGMVA